MFVAPTPRFPLPAANNLEFTTFYCKLKKQIMLVQNKSSQDHMQILPKKSISHLKKPWKIITLLQ